MVAIVGILIMQYLQELINLSVMPTLLLANFPAVLYSGLQGNVLVGISTLFTIISGAIYLKQNWNLFKNSK